jgi:hypothetical protein
MAWNSEEPGVTETNKVCRHIYTYFRSLFAKQDSLPYLPVWVYVHMDMLWLCILCIPLCCIHQGTHWHSQRRKGLADGTCSFMCCHWLTRSLHYIHGSFLKSPKSSILIGFSLINHQFLGYPNDCGNHHIRGWSPRMAASQSKLLSTVLECSWSMFVVDYINWGCCLKDN